MKSFDEIRQDTEEAIAEFRKYWDANATTKEEIEVVEILKYGVLQEKEETAD